MSSSNNQFGTPPRIPNQPGQMNQNMMQSPGGASQFGNSFSPQQSKKGGGFGKQAQQGASAKPESDDTVCIFKLYFYFRQIWNSNSIQSSMDMIDVLRWS